jgi:hypothetical protein
VKINQPNLIKIKSNWKILYSANKYWAKINLSYLNKTLTAADRKIGGREKEREFYKKIKRESQEILNWKANRRG